LIHPTIRPQYTNVAQKLSDQYGLTRSPSVSSFLPEQKLWRQMAQVYYGTRPSCHRTNSVKALTETSASSFHQCFDTVGWVTGRTCPMIPSREDHSYSYHPIFIHHYVALLPLHQLSNASRSGPIRCLIYTDVIHSYSVSQTVTSRFTSV